MQVTMKSKPSIQELVRRAQKGDRDAFSELADVHRDSLEALARLRMSSELRRKVEVADIVQETLARSLESIGAFRSEGDGSFGRWLNGIARNVILKAARTHAIPLESADDWDVADSSPSAGRMQRRDERFDRLEAALKELTPDQREVVRLARIQGHTAREIARRTGRTEGAVKQLMLRALRNLRRGLGDTESLHLPDRSLDSEDDPPDLEPAGEPSP